MSLLNNMLDLGKLEDGQMSLDSQPMCLHSVASSVLMVLRILVTDGVQLEMDVPEDLWILGDHTRWSQLLINLGTAVKLFPGPSSLIITPSIHSHQTPSSLSVQRSQVYAERFRAHRGAA
jgi:K+-sensing histidine kinase KdpD